ncbi:MAG: YjbQ family protein [Chryseobacterium sp.]|nr:MAG: YjbQ family protein [Chryseobacterium sp.]
MKILQTEIVLKPQPRGFHSITDEILRQLPDGMADIKAGLCQIFIQHTSASLSINEDADPSVRNDFESWFNQTVKEDEPIYTHTYEGADDMPAHLKTALLDTSLLIPIRNGKLALGRWQGIYLGEHRNNATARKLLITVFGE